MYAYVFIQYSMGGFYLKDEKSEYLHARTRISDWTLDMRATDHLLLLTCQVC